MTDRRTSILNAAIHVVAQHGVRALRVEAVAAEAGVAVSLLYYHFGSRAGLVRATLQHANDRAIEAMRVPTAHGRNGRELVDATLLSELDDDARTRETAVVWGEVVASAVFDPEIREALRTASTAWAALVARTIEIGREDGSIDLRIDADATAQRLTATVEGLSARWLAGLLERERACELLAQTIEACLSVPAAVPTPTAD